MPPDRLAELEANVAACDVVVDELVSLVAEMYATYPETGPRAVPVLAVTVIGPLIEVEPDRCASVLAAAVVRLARVQGRIPAGAAPPASDLPVAAAAGVMVRSPHKIDTCGCGAPVIWVQLRGKRVSVDAEPVDATRGGGRILLAAALAAGVLPQAWEEYNPRRLFGKRVYRRHLSGCPFRGRWMPPEAFGGRR